MGRVEEYWTGSTWTTERKAAAVLASPAAVRAAALRLSQVIPPQYFVGTCQHETNFALNERDTEPNGVITWGPYQMTRDEAARVGVGDPFRLFDLEVATRAFVELQERRLAELQRAAAARGQLDPPAADQLAYLTIEHNQGEHAADLTIRNYGVNWTAYQRRNLEKAQADVDIADAVLAQARKSGAASAIAAAEQAAREKHAKIAWWRGVFAYGNDVITGGERWAEALRG